MNMKLNVVLAAGLISMGTMATATAATVSGGGATLPAPLYQVVLPQVGSFSYDLTGSGTGKTAFLTNTPSLFASATTTVDFTGSDSILSASQISTYNNQFRSSYGPLLQIPSVLTPVVLPFNKQGLGQLDLTRAQVCGIFAGDITNWSQIASGMSGTIQVAYRQEGSGTTELLSNFLASQCQLSPNPNGSNRYFTVSNQFVDVVAHALPSGASPASLGWLPAEGNPGVNTVMTSTNNTFGYMSPAYDYPIDSGDVARIQGTDGAYYAPTSVTLGANPPAINDANPSDWVAPYTAPAAGYPIYGTTQLIVGQCYADSTVAELVKDFVRKLHDGTFDSDILANNFYSLPQAWQDNILGAFVNNGAPQQINGPICAFFAGRPAH